MPADKKDTSVGTDVSMTSGDEVVVRIQLNKKESETGAKPVDAGASDTTGDTKKKKSSGKSTSKTSKSKKEDDKDEKKNAGWAPWVFASVATCALAYLIAHCFCGGKSNGCKDCGDNNNEPKKDSVAVVVEKPCEDSIPGNTILFQADEITFNVAYAKDQSSALIQNGDNNAGIAGDENFPVRRAKPVIKNDKTVDTIVKRNHVIIEEDTIIRRKKPVVIEEEDCGCKDPEPKPCVYEETWLFQSSAPAAAAIISGIKVR